MNGDVYIDKCIYCHKNSPKRLYECIDRMVVMMKLIIFVMNTTIY